MRQTLLEHVRGFSDIRTQADDQIVRKSSYDIRVWQEYTQVRDSDGTSWLPASKRIDGRVFDEVPRVGDRLYIILDDGRRFNFFVTNARGSVANAPGGTFP